MPRDPLARKRIGALRESRMERDSVAVATGLRQLGGPACRLDPPVADPVVRITSPTSRAIAVPPGPSAATPTPTPTPDAPSPTPTASPNAAETPGG